MSTDVAFTRENLDRYLSALAKEFRKRNGSAMQAEIVLIGGASVLANYSFREATYDVDAIIHASSAMKEAINHVSDVLNLPNGWLNTDFAQTRSYSPKLLQYSTYYKTFSHVLTIRTIAAEYLIAMKLMAGRKYKNDLSDVIGILFEHQKNGKPIDKAKIDHAMQGLYGGWENVPEDSKRFIAGVMQNGDYETLYQKCQSEELANRSVLIEAEKKHPGITNEDDIAKILNAARAKKASQKDGPTR
ncbi:MAG TPA: DUF6036 family nucleotidyltransferase [Clostridia bacterium]|nr:DUF6036 family nucleotidyltransferase [Clostridia bacterium]